MSNERRDHDAVTDSAVSTVYREFSDERAPEHLDHEILNMARDAAKDRHRSAMGWLRPAAWVATVGLCLAIVVEVTQTPLQEQAELATEADRGPNQDAAATGTGAANRADGTVAPRRSQYQKSEAAPGDYREEAPAAIEVESLRDSDRQFLREAEDRARLQVGSDEEAAAARGLSAPVLKTASDVPVPRNCGEEQTGNADLWIACILELESRGMQEAAALERRLLEETFPGTLVPTETGQPGSIDEH